MMLFSSLRRWAALALLTCAGAALAQADNKNCVLLLLHDRDSSPQALAGFARKLAPACTGRPVEMPWSQRRANDRDIAGARQELARQVASLRQQGFALVAVGGVGYGANAAMSYASAVGDIDAVVAVAAQDNAAGIGSLPDTAASLRQHIPTLWVIGTEDPLFARGETHAYAKAPPHPSSRYAPVKADRRGTLDAAVKEVSDWLKSLQ